MSGLFDDAGNPPRRSTATRPRPAPTGRSRALMGTAAVLVFSFFLLSALTDVWTDRLWFDSVGYSEVFNKVLGTRVLLFVVFGALMGGFVALNVVIAFRRRPSFRPMATEPGLDRYRDALDPLRKWVVIAAAGLLALIGGGSASGQWRSFLLWRHGQPFGTEDPYFNRDIGFFIFDLPWWHYVVNFALMTVVLGLVAAVVVHYVFGGIRLQSRGDKLSSEAQVQLSVLLGLFVLVKAVDYYFDRFDLTTDQGRRFTGINYTAYHAVLPSKTILTYIAVICAALFFANVLRRTWLLPTIGLGLLVLSAILLGALWPGIVWQFQVRPSEPDKEQDFIARNIEATRAAYDVENVDEQPYNAAVAVTEEAVQRNTASLRGVRLIDPARTSQAFEQLQQVRGYYSVAPVLDVDRYEIGGTTRDVVLGVRELDQSGLVDEQRGWANEHTVYTHGFGVIAAYGNNRDAEGNAPLSTESAEPPWAEEDLPPRGELSELTEDGYEPRIYFGEKSPTYSIVGKPTDGIDVELDIPEEASSSGERGTNTYDGEDGVPVGGVFNKFLYALKFGEPNILLANRVHENSRILYERHPRERVEKVAPWLTVDQDPYPAVVDGRVVWILDGYTMSDRYPNSERESLEEMTTDALAPITSYVTLPTDQINYMRNSVKAVVDAYDGSVKLYEWQEDPIVEAWSEAFPDVVRDREEIPDSLMAHLRYPEDMFKVQRHILATYHVTEPQDFYKGTDFWKVPEDPADPANKQPPYRLSVQLPAAETTEETEEATGEAIGPADASGEEAETDAAAVAAATPQGSPKFSLTSVYVPTGRNNLASFISVDSEPTDEGYGRIRILRLPDNTQVQGPSQIANTFAADDNIQTALFPIKQNSRVLYGNLLTLPVGGGLLYVQPVYALRESGQGAYPVLRFVLASFGENAGYGRTLNEALDDVLETGSFTDPGSGDGGDPGGQGSEGEEPGTGTSEEVLDLLRQADEKYAEAQQALQSGDTVRWARLTGQAEALFQQALDAAEEANAAAAESGSAPPEPDAEQP